MGFSKDPLSPDEIEQQGDFLNAEVDRFLERYDALPKAADLPLRAAFRVEEFAEFLPDILLYEVLDGGEDVVCRVAGENIKANYGGNQTGQRLSDIIRANPSVAHFRDNFREVIESRRPVRRREVYTDLLGIRKTTIGAIAPLSRDGRAVDFCLCLALNAIYRQGRLEKATWENQAYRR